MKFTRFVVPAIGVIAVLLAFAAACGKKTPTVDVVNGISPVSTSLAGVRVTMDQLAQLPPAERAARLQRDWPHLAEEVGYYARNHSLIPSGANVERIEFVYGSLAQVRANDGAGAGHDGKADNQLIARVHVAGQASPIDLFVVCLNGMVADPRDMGKLQTLTTSVPAQQFTIGRREGLVHHVDYPLAIDLAERFNLPLYAGQQMREADRITPERAWRMEPDTARVQVTVRVYEGDRFDLVANTYTPAHRAVPKKAVPHRKAPAKKAAVRRRPARNAGFRIPGKRTTDVRRLADQHR